MKIPTIVILTVLFSFACNTGNDRSKVMLDDIFTNNYEHSIISKGDNLPNFDRRKDSLDLFLVSINENVDPIDFQERIGWSDQVTREKIDFLILSNVLLDNWQQITDRS